LEACLPISFLDQLQDMKLGTLGPFGIKEVIFHVSTSLVGFGCIISPLLAKTFFLRDLQLL
jgi:hypothetical protein